MPSIPFALLNGDVKQAFLDFFKIQAGGTGAVVTVPVIQNRVINWTAMAVEQDIANIIGKPMNDPSNAFMDYRPDSPPANLDLAGKDVLAAMRIVASQYHTNKGESNESTRNSCLTTGFSPTHWSDIQLHYYCLLGEPRSCYTYSTSGGKPRVDSYADCAKGIGSSASGFKWVADNQAVMFRWMMFSQTRTFKIEQEQNIINEFYDVIQDPSGNITAAECNAKRPRRTEDPTDGTHCMPNKIMKPKLLGKSR